MYSYYTYLNQWRLINKGGQVKPLTTMIVVQELLRNSATSTNSAVGSTTKQLVHRPPAGLPFCGFLVIHDVPRAKLQWRMRVVQGDGRHGVDAQRHMHPA